ncbi:MAG: sugar transporter substrate-binding protein [Planctomycetaceae bacterium]|nr:sugar transporter substrate-binding protein [Planctomycetaceae bacterium]
MRSMVSSCCSLLFGANRRTGGLLRQLTLWFLLIPALTGCASLTNPVAGGIPVRLVPPELLAEARDQKRTVPLAWLRRPPVKDYRLGPGDILGIYIDGVLGDRGTLPPVMVPDATNLPPSVGVPIPVREDGTLPLPLVTPVKVEGLTVLEAEQAIIEAYSIKRKIVRLDTERILVTLMRPRYERILVIRQDNPHELATATTLGTGNFRGLSNLATTATTPHAGTGTIVDLPANENDVLNVITRTGGLPGQTALNEIVIQRGGLRADDNPEIGATDGTETVRIPLRVNPGERPKFKPEDVILRTGDIVFIEARLAEVYYTAGLLGAREIPLPRDVDITAVEAIARSGGPLVNGGINSSNLSGQIVSRGIGNPSPSLLSVLRHTPDGRQVNIRVDLNRALQDPSENLLIQAGDVLVLQETPGEATARFLTNVVTFNFLADLFTAGSGSGTASAVLPGS